MLKLSFTILDPLKDYIDQMIKPDQADECACSPVAHELSRHQCSIKLPSNLEPLPEFRQICTEPDCVDAKYAVSSLLEARANEIYVIG